MLKITVTNRIYNLINPIQLKWIENYYIIIMYKVCNFTKPEMIMKTQYKILHYRHIKNPLKTKGICHMKFCNTISFNAIIRLDR